MSGHAFRPPFRFAAIRMALAGAAAAGLLTLAACSGAGDTADDTAPDAGSSAPASSAPASSAPASSAPASAPSSAASDDSSSNDSGDDSGSGDSAGKPTKEQVTAGLVKYYESTGVTGEPAKKTAACLVDNLYDTMSTDGLKALADGKLPTDSKDGQAFAKAGGACVKEMTGGN